jgi:hypothetical protein
MDLLVLADLYNVLGQYERAIETILRWLRLPKKVGSELLGSRK